MWKGINPAVGGMTNAINAVFGNIPAHHLCSMDGAQSIHILSDYGGHSSSSRYDTYAYLLLDLNRCRDGFKALREVRMHYRLANRRMAYKALGDSRRAAAIVAFVDAACALHGHVVTFAVAKTVDTMFHRQQTPNDDAVLSALAARYKPGVHEHLARILHFFSIVAAGFSSPGQDLNWFTDVDSIAPEQDWLTGLVKLAGNLASHYLTHNLGHLRVGTTRSDDGTLLLEDLCAVPDLFAGSVAEALTHQSVSSLDMPTGMIVPVRCSAKKKAVDLLVLLWNRPKTLLRSTCICIDPDGSRWRIQARHFHQIPMV